MRSARPRQAAGRPTAHSWSALLARLADELGSLGPALRSDGGRRQPSAVAVLERRLAPLRLGERERPGADSVVQLVLDLVDRCGARVRLGPEVARIGRVAAELEADQVVLLERRRRAAETGTGRGPAPSARSCSRPAAGPCASSRGRQIVVRIVACVTSGLRTPGVSVQLARTTLPDPPEPPERCRSATATTSTATDRSTISTGERRIPITVRIAARGASVLL